METVSKQLYSKINLIKKIIERASNITEFTKQAKAKALLASIDQRLSDLEVQHILKTSDLAILSSELEDRKKELTIAELTKQMKKIKDRYMKVISDENIINNLNIIAKDSSVLIDLVKSKSEQNKMTSYLDKFYSTVSCDISNYIEIDDYTLCTTCNLRMVSDFDTSELQCPKCGNIFKLVGTVYNDSINCSIDKSKNKSGVFNPNRHFQHWWQHILAKEPEEELGDTNDTENQHGEKLLAKLEAIIKRDRKIRQLLTVNDIRKMLKELKRTDLNKDVPLILKKLTGIGPPLLGDEFSSKVEKLFTKAIEIGEKQMKPSRTNRNYYPYYIYKIIDAITPEADFETRRVLYYIYLQSSSTISQADNDWKIITRHLEEIEFKVTDRTQYLKYAPH
jgi:hypothetical protein